MIALSRDGLVTGQPTCMLERATLLIERTDVLVVFRCVLLGGRRGEKSSGRIERDTVEDTLT